MNKKEFIICLGDQVQVYGDEFTKQGDQLYLWRRDNLVMAIPNTRRLKYLFGGISGKYYEIEKR